MFHFSLMHLFATAKQFYSFALKQIVLRDVTQRLQLFRTSEHSLFACLSTATSEHSLTATGPEKHHAMNATSSKALASQESDERLNSGPGDGPWPESSHST